MANELAPTGPLVDPYLDPVRFPLTTQKGLNLKEQKMIDAVNTDGLRNMFEEGKQLSEREQAIAKELVTKAKMLGIQLPPGL